MVGTLILLYALNTAGEVPTGCFIAAWVIVIIQVIGEIAKLFINKR